MMNMNNKSAMVRTLEAFIAVILVFFFLLVFFSTQKEKNFEIEKENYLMIFINDEGFRQCVFEEDDLCVKAYVEDVMPPFYSFAVSISKGYAPEVFLPDKKIYIDSLFISSNRTDYDDRIVKLYYWEK